MDPLAVLVKRLCIKYVFVWSHQSVRFKGNIETPQKGITSGMECTDDAAFTFATSQIRLCLLCKFISAEATVINLIYLHFWEYFLWV